MAVADPVMTFGRYRGRPVSSVQTSYLAWVVRECQGVPEPLLVAIREELARRRAGPTPHPQAPALPPQRQLAAPRSLPADQQARLEECRQVIDLLHDLTRAGVQLVARGDGNVLHREATPGALSPPWSIGSGVAGSTWTTWRAASTRMTLAGHSAPWHPC